MEDAEAEQTCQVFVPGPLLRSIAALVVQDEPSPSNRLLVLLSMCGVCHQWRQVAREVAAQTALAFEGQENAPPGPGGMMARFRKSPTAQKAEVFVAAAKLLKGYSDITLSGEAITDDVLYAIAATNAAALRTIRLRGATRVSDAALAALFAAAPSVQHVSISELGPAVTCAFLPRLVVSCRHLMSVALDGAPGIEWGMMDWARAAEAAAAASAARMQQHHQQQQRRAAARVAEEAATDGELATVPGAPRGAWSDSLSASGSAVASGSRGPALSPPASPTPGHAHEQQQQQQQQLAFDHGRQQDLSSLSIGASGMGASSAGGASLSEELAGARAAAGSDGGTRGAGGSGGSGGGSDAEPGGSNGGGGGGNLLAAVTAAFPGLHLHPRAPDAPPPPPPPRRPLPLRLMRRLQVTNARTSGLPQLLALLPGLDELQLDGSAVNIHIATVTCPNLQRLSYVVENPSDMDEALWSLTGLPRLRALTVIVKGPLLHPDQLRILGMLPLTELRLDSWAYKQQPTLSRPAFSHVSNEGVKALVDAVCERMVNAREATALKLSLAGATTINHEAVSALLRLPVLTELDIAGCTKISPMDKMRLVAKVKAGRELIASGRPLTLRASARFPQLVFL